jgi:hypothetical protein
MCSELPQKIPLTCQKDEGEQEEEKPSVTLLRGHQHRRAIYFDIVIFLTICSQLLFLS